jgi:CubicO group peptidase (beta-lactamase class C family)
MWQPVVLGLWLTAATAAVPSPPLYPLGAWERVAEPRALGYPPSRLAALRSTLARGQTTAMMIVVGGRVLFEYGDPTERSYIASARKSLVSMLYGNQVASGRIPLDKTLRQLGIDDKGSAAEVARTSPFVAGLGYGLLWWTFDEAAAGTPLHGAYTASGAFGQFVTVIPALDMVVAHKVAVPAETYFGTILPLVINPGSGGAGRTGGAPR